MNVYQELGIESIINAAGSMTTLGGSIIYPEITDAMAAASRHFVDIQELHQAAGRRIAELVGVEAAHVCACASAGITLMAAACMAGTDQTKITRLPDSSGMKNKFIVHQSHRNPFDHALYIAGGRFIEISADMDELAEALKDEIAAVYYTFAWFCGGEVLPLEQVTQVAHGVGVPVIVDAAGQVPPVANLSRFMREGADLVTFSGGKSIRGPQSSGVILGRKEMVEACAMNDSPHVKSIGRGMKAGKEEIVGLVKAIELYLQKDHAAEMTVWEQRVSYLVDALSPIDGVEVQRKLPYGIGYLIPYVSLWWSEKELGVTLQQLVGTLREGKPRIAVRLVESQSPGVERPQVWLCVHTLQEGEEVIVARRIKEILIGEH
jgi:L-seryl-tRNA(Ser) seleniumtransferase